MARTVTVNGVAYSVPEPGDTGYDATLTSYLVALASGCIQLGGGWTLTSELDLGANYGLLLAYLKTRTSNGASAGLIRLAKTDLIDWRNNANSGNLALGIDAADKLTFNSEYLTGNPFAAYTTNTGSIANGGAYAQVNFATQEQDTDTAVATGASWKFTVPTSKGGDYDVSVAVSTAGVTGIIGLQLFKNNALLRQLAYVTNPAASQVIAGAAKLRLAAADYIDVRAHNTSAGSVNLTTNHANNWIQIKKCAP